MTKEQENSLEDNLRFLKNGSVPYLCVRIKNSDVEIAKSLCEIDSLYTKVTKAEYDKENVLLWISKKEKLLGLLDDLTEKPNRIESYGISKLLGFGDEEICEMIND